VDRRAHDQREVERQDLKLAAAGEERDALVVVDVDDRVDVGPQAQDLAIELMADARRPGAVQQPGADDLGDDEMVERRLLEGDAGVLGVDDAGLPSELWT
jgi:hypothetical protein